MTERTYTRYPAGVLVSLDPAGNGGFAVFHMDWNNKTFPVHYSPAQCGWVKDADGKLLILDSQACYYTKGRHDMALYQPYSKAGALEALANQRMEEAARALAAAEVEREIEAKFGEDDWPDETVLYFNHQFNNAGLRYTYIAFKIRGAWYIGGRDGARWSWERLVEFMKDTTELWSVETWKKEF